MIPPSSFRRALAAARRDRSSPPAAYVAHEVAYHQAVIDALNGTLIPAIKNSELKAFVEKVGPAFQGHLEAAKQLQKKLTA